MTTQNRKKDDELLIWLIVGGLFTFFLLGIDIWYSSYHQMDKFYCWLIVFLHFILVVGWINTIATFGDPNYEWIRKFVCVLALGLSLMVGIHHATAREDKQVTIDSKENADKQKRADSLYKIKYLPHVKDSAK